MKNAEYSIVECSVRSNPNDMKQTRISNLFIGAIG